MRGRDSGRGSPYCRGRTLYPLALTRHGVAMIRRLGTAFAPSGRLGAWLVAQARDTTMLAFPEIKAILGHPLPPRARSTWTRWW